MYDTGSTVADFACRLRSVRLRLRLTQREMAAAANVKYRSWQDYESGKSIPGGKVLAALAIVGINTNWLLTGAGPVRVHDESGSGGRGLLQAVVDAIGDVLLETAQRHTPEEQAAVLAAFRRLYQRLSAEPASDLLAHLEEPP
jgi:transcriptional regulator with XRE-family HTH domain